MRVVKSIYEDSKGKLWEVEKVSLPKLNKKKGNQSFYTAECKELNKSYRETLKREIIKKIKTYKYE